MITENLILCSTGNPPVQVINATQGETNARTLEITLIDESGAELPLMGLQAYLYVEKLDGNIVEETGTVNGNTASFALHTQAMTCPGKNKMFVQLVNSTKTEILRVDGMVLDVMPCKADKAEPSETVLTAAQEATINANNAAEEARSYVGSVTTESIGALPADSERLNHIEEGIAAAFAAANDKLKTGYAKVIFDDPGALSSGEYELKFSQFDFNVSGGMITINSDRRIALNERVKMALFEIAATGNAPFNLYPAVNGWEACSQNILARCANENAFFVTPVFSNPTGTSGTFILSVYFNDNDFVLDLDPYWRYVKVTVLYY